MPESRRRRLLLRLWIDVSFHAFLFPGLCAPFLLLHHLVPQEILHTPVEGLVPWLLFIAGMAVLLMVLGLGMQLGVGLWYLLIGRRVSERALYASFNGRPGVAQLREAARSVERIAHRRRGD